MERVLVIRPEPGASATLRRALDRGLNAVSEPLFEIEPVAWKAPEFSGFDGLLVTSANAMRCGGKALERLRELSVFAVGEVTAAAARDAGFAVEIVGNSGAEDLLGMLDPGLRLLHLCGEDRHEPAQAPQDITRLTVYRSRPVEATGLLGAHDVTVLVHSPRAAGRLAELIKDRTTVSIVAISNAAANAAGTGWRSLDVACEPTDEALLALAVSLCNKPNPE